jgi:hypothetical protein
MAPPSAEKTATLNFRVSPEIPDMLRQLAEVSDVTMTEYVTIVIRAAFTRRFPDAAAAYQTPAERLEREILVLGAPRQQAPIDPVAAAREVLRGHAERERLTSSKKGKAKPRKRPR